MEWMMPNCRDRERYLEDSRLGLQYLRDTGQLKTSTDRQIMRLIIDHVLQSIRGQFDQKDYRILCRLEALLCSAEVEVGAFDDVLTFYGSDFNSECLAIQLHVPHSNLPKEDQSEKGGVKFRSIIKFLRSLSPAECQLYSAVTRLVKLILVMSATNAVSERSFSALRRVKKWLRNTKGQVRLNWYMILHVHNDETDSLDLKAIANEFVSRNSSRRNILETLFPCEYNYIDTLLQLKY